MPYPPKGIRLAAQRDQRPGNVRQVVQAMGHIQTAKPAGASALHRGPEQNVADDAVGTPGP